MLTIWFISNQLAMSKIIGVGNGDPSSHEPDKCADGAWQSYIQRKNVKIIQAGTTVGFEIRGKI